jgi:DNA-binding MarR family transcriptional regulator
VVPDELTGPGGSPASVGFALSQLGLATARGFAALVGTIGLEPRHFALLRAASQFAGDSQQALADRLGIAASTMVGLVDQLEAQGLVARVRSASDRRAHALRLTPVGVQRLQRASELGMQRELELSAGLTDDERRTLLELLARVAANLGVAPGALPDLGEGHAAAIAP